jgi:hypothetical protein
MDQRPGFSLGIRSALANSSNALRAVTSRARGTANLSNSPGRRKNANNTIGNEINLSHVINSNSTSTVFELKSINDANSSLESRLHSDISMKTPYEQEEILLELGKNRSSSWKIMLLGDFSELASAQINSCNNVNNGRDRDSINFNAFCSYMRQRYNTSPSWCKALFYTFSKFDDNTNSVSTATTTYVNVNGNEINTGIGIDDITSTSASDISVDGASSEIEEYLSKINMTAKSLDADDNIEHLSPENDHSDSGDKNQKNQHQEPKYMTPFLFICAICAATVKDSMQDNTVWLNLRRSVVYRYYINNYGNHCNGKGSFNFDCFCAFLNECGECDSKTSSSTSSSSPASGSPLYYGIVNGLWKAGFDESNEISTTFTNPSQHMEQWTKSADSDSDDKHEIISSSEDITNIIEKLALSKQQLAEKQMEIDEYQLKYRKLEKQLCDLKLELAQVKARKG